MKGVLSSRVVIEYLMPNALKISDFMAGPVKEFSLYDCVRSIPSVVDGFKVSQRKAIFGALKTGAVSDEVKVSQLANAVAGVSHYHHGEGSMAGTIVGMAQTFPGSNNVNFFEPEGSFGSRLDHGAGAARYIFTKLTPSFRKLFHRDDDLILKHLDEDGAAIEPNFYLPILPVVLINGASGVGTGFATEICGYNPEDLRKYILNRLEGKRQSVKLVPWYRDYHGTVTRTATGQVVFKGKLEKVNSTTIRVTELPIGMQQQDYRDLLIKWIDSGFVKDYNDSSTRLSFDFELKVPRSTGYLGDEELYHKLKLIGRTTENFTVWLPNDKLRCFSSAEELCDYFSDFRVKKYEERRAALVVKYQALLASLQEKLRFVKFYLANAEKFSKKTKLELETLLKAEGFVNVAELVAIRIYQLTKDMIEELEKEILEAGKTLVYYEGTCAADMYVKELKELKL